MEFYETFLVIWCFVSVDDVGVHWKSHGFGKDNWRPLFIDIGDNCKSEVLYLFHQVIVDRLLTCIRLEASSKRWVIYNYEMIKHIFTRCYWCVNRGDYLTNWIKVPVLLSMWVRASVYTSPLEEICFILLILKPNICDF